MSRALTSSSTGGCRAVGAWHPEGVLCHALTDVETLVAVTELDELVRAERLRGPGHLRRR